MLQSIVNDNVSNTDNRENSQLFDILDSTQSELSSTIDLLLSNSTITDKLVLESGNNDILNAIKSIKKLESASSGNFDSLSNTQRVQYFKSAETVTKGISTLKKSNSPVQIKLESIVDGLSNNLQMTNISDERFAEVLSDIKDAVNIANDGSIDMSVLNDINSNDRQSKEQLQLILQRTRELSKDKFIKQTYGTLFNKFDSLFIDFDEFEKKTSTRFGGNTARSLAEQGEKRSDIFGGIGSLLLNNAGPFGQIASTLIAATNEITGTSLSSRIASGISTSIDSVFTKETLQRNESDNTDEPIDTQKQNTPIVQKNIPKDSVNEAVNAEAARDSADAATDQVEIGKSSIGLLTSIDSNILQLLDKGVSSTSSSSKPSESITDTITDTIIDTGTSVVTHALTGGAGATTAAVVADGASKAGLFSRMATSAGNLISKVPGGKTVISAGKFVASKASGVLGAVKNAGAAVLSEAANAIPGASKLAAGIASKSPLLAKAGAFASGALGAVGTAVSKISVPLQVAYAAYQTGQIFKSALDLRSALSEEEVANIKMATAAENISKRRLAMRDKIESTLSPEILANKHISTRIVSTPGELARYIASGIIVKSKNGKHQFAQVYLDRAKKRTESDVLKEEQSGLINKLSTTGSLSKTDSARLSEVTTGISKTASQLSQKSKLKLPNTSKASNVSIKSKISTATIPDNSLLGSIAEMNMNLSKIADSSGNTIINNNNNSVEASTTSDKFIDNSIYIVDEDSY